MAINPPDFEDEMETEALPGEGAGDETAPDKADESSAKGEYGYLDELVAGLEPEELAYLQKIVGEKEESEETPDEEAAEQAKGEELPDAEEADEA